jgi:hypothetical protein
LLAKVAVGKSGPLQSYSVWGNNKGSCIDTKKYDSCLGFSAATFPDSSYVDFNGLKVPIKSAKLGSNANIVYNVN